VVSFTSLPRKNFQKKITQRDWKQSTKTTYPTFFIDGVGGKMDVTGEFERSQFHG